MAETPNGNGDDRLVKRRKQNGGLIAHSQPRAATRTSTASSIFAPYRTVGLVSSTNVPFTSLALGKTTFQITTSVGRALQTYDLRRGLNLVFITRPQTPGQITASVAWKQFVFAAWSGNDETGSQLSGVWVYKRGKQVGQLSTPRPITEPLQSLSIFGSWIVACSKTKLYVWATLNLEHYTTLQTNPDAPFTGCVTTLPTLLNKCLLGKQDGTVELWNVSSGKLVYTLLPPSTEHGPVTALEPVPVLSLVAIGYGNGHLLIHDVRTDSTVLSFYASDTSSAVTSIAFRTDGLGAGQDGAIPGVMATTCRSSGDITMWDLNNGGRKTGVLRGAHETHTERGVGGVGKIEFLPGQAILVSSGLDNSLKTWIFDETPFSTIPRPLHARSGHGGPVTSLNFLPSASDGSEISGKWLMAGSRDRSLWGWSLRRDGQSTELSQGAVRKKAKKMGILSADSQDSLSSLKVPPVTAIACSLNRDGGVGAIPGKQPIWLDANQRRGASTDTESSSMTGWESVVTAHQGEDKARTWFWGRKRAGRWTLATSDSKPVTAVTISPCGTFALIGSASGSIDLFNLQSGLHRQRYPPRLTPKQAKHLKQATANKPKSDHDAAQETYFRGQGKHKSAVTGLAIDNLNRTIISCGGQDDSFVKFWNFKTGLLEHQLDFSAAGVITGLVFQRSSELLAIGCSDGAVRVIDPSSLKTVRELRASRSPDNPLIRCSFTDFTVSDDGKWIAAAVDDLVVLWDLPSGQLIDAFKLANKCTALSFSPTGEYLATAEAGSVGIDIWSNRTLFTHVSTRRLSEEDLLAVINSTETVRPTASGERGQQLINAAQDTEEAEDDDLIGLNTDTLSDDLMSLSLVPRSRWQNLLHMDAIRARNKPIEPPKKPEKAPFFLPSLQQGPEPNATSTSAAITNGKSAINDSVAGNLGVSQELVALNVERSRIARMDRQGGQSAFSRLLQQCTPSDDCSAFAAHFKSLSPAVADIEIRSLSMENCEMLAFVRALLWVQRTRGDFELGQTWMAVFLRLHGDVVINDAQVRAAVSEWRDGLRLERERVASMAEYCSGMVEYLRAGRV